MTIENLLKAVPPPERPVEAFDGPWERVEAELGTPLPQDYKHFVRLYGYGYFMEFMGVDVPRAKNPNVRLEWQVRRTSDALSDTEDELTYPLWPAPGGLMSFGGTDNGDYLFWLTEGAPEQWRVVVWDRGNQECELIDCGLTDFLAGLASGAIIPQGFPADLVMCDHLFQPDDR